MNRFVAGPDGGPTITLRLGVTLDRVAREDAPDLEATSAPVTGSVPDLRFEWSGSLLAWLEFVDVLEARVATSDDPDFGMLVRWLDEDLDAEIDAADRVGARA